MKTADYYPEHDRTSCSDASPVNAEAAGSNGCARCTAIMLDQRDQLIAAADAVLKHVDGRLPIRGWLRDNDASRAALQLLREARDQAKGGAA